MSKQFAVIHVEKGSGNATRLGSHIERKFNPQNADPNKSNLNRHLITGNQNLNKDIDERIKQSGAKVRKNSVKHLNIVLTGSHDKMKEIEADPERLQKWIEDNHKFLEEKYGKENIMRLSLHCDERTPHLHAVVTPITPDNRLSAKQIVGNKKDLQQLQTNYAERMKKFNLSRGIEGSTATHDSIKEYYAKINNPVKSEINIPIKKPNEDDFNYVMKVNKSIEPLIFEKKNLEKQIQGVQEKEQNIIKQKRAVEQEKNNLETEKRRVYDQAFKNLNQAFKKLDIPFKLIKKENGGYRLKHNYHEDIEKSRQHGHKKAVEQINDLLKENGINYQVKVNYEKNSITLEKNEPKKNKNKGMEM